MNYLDCEYFFDQEGRMLQDIDFVRGDCFPLNTYLIIKNKYPEILNTSDIILDDINFAVTFFDKERTPHIGYKNDSLVREGLVNYDSYEFVQGGEEAKEELFQFINREKIFMIQTVNQLLPYHKDYNPNYGTNSFRPDHAFLILNYDENYVYFVEDVSQINYEKYNAYDDKRKDIGIIKVEDLLKAIGLYIKITTVSVNMEKYQKLDDLVIEILKKSVFNYYTTNTKESNETSYIGREAILQLIKISDMEYLLLDSVSSALGPINLYFRWKFRTLRNKRYITYLFFERHTKKNHSRNYDQLKEVLKKDYKAWNTIWSVFEKKYQKGDYLWDKNLKKYFAQILQIEDELFYLLGKL